MKVLSVVGARPQFVKAAAVSPVLREHHDEVLVHTGQHYDEALSDVFFEELGIPHPDYNLGIGSDSHGEQTAAMMSALEPVVLEENPDVVLVYGDTNSTLAAAIVTSKLDPDLAHVEAGLRSGDLDTPEEVNRILTDRVSDLLFAPTKGAVETLHSEGIERGVHFTGDVMYDTLLRIRSGVRETSTILEDLDIADAEGEYVLATLHRQRNTDNPERLKTIFDGFAAIDRPIVLPAHPRTTAALREHGLEAEAEAAVELVDPVGYLDFIRLLDGAWRVATDSGGVQKEAFFLDTPCVTLREETEWTETVASGWNELVGADPAQIQRALTRDWTPGDKPAPYGDGNAAEKIVHLLESDVESTASPGLSSR